MESLRICGRGETHHFIGRGFSHMISIGDCDDSFDGLRLSEIPPKNHLCLRFSDTEDLTRSDAPSLVSLSPLFDWLSSSRIDALLVHCTAGIGRSPAVALLALSALESERDPMEHMARIIESCECSHIWPNRLVVELGDSILGREGAVVSVLDEWRSSQSGRSRE